MGFVYKKSIDSAYFFFFFFFKNDDINLFLIYKISIAKMKNIEDKIFSNPEINKRIRIIITK